MVVLSAAICARSGKSLMSRQFVDMQRSRIESLLSAFPKLMGTTGSAGSESKKIARQHTFIETENVRYLFQPLEGVYLVVITNKASNIVEDLETLRLLAKIVPEYCGGIVTEDQVLENVFELIFAFDEVISLGYRESISLQQVRINLEMDSHEEKLHDMIQKSKEEEAKREAKKKAKQMQAERRERAKSGITSMPSTSSSSYEGFGSSSSGGGGGGGNGSGSSESSSFNSSSSNNNNNSSSSSSSTTSSTSSSSRKPKSGGMMIGAKKDKKKSKFLSGMSTGKPSATNAAAAAVVDDGQPTAPLAATHVQVHEDLSIVMKQDMSVESMVVKGFLALTCREEDKRVVDIQLDGDSITNGQGNDFTYKCNPKMNAGNFKSQHVLCLKNKGRPFPENKAVKILQWRMSTTDETKVPLTFNCWPESQGDGTITVTIEYTLENTDLTLYDVTVRIPLGEASDSPDIQNIQEGSFRHNSRMGFLEWTIPTISEDNLTGTLEFVMAGDEEEGFFPVEVNFTSETLLGGPGVVAVVSGTTDGEPITFTNDCSLSVAKYTISFDE